MEGKIISVDNDQDGNDVEDGDCKDNDPTIHPEQKKRIGVGIDLNCEPHQIN